MINSEMMEIHQMREAAVLVGEGESHSVASRQARHPTKRQVRSRKIELRSAVIAGQSRACEVVEKFCSFINIAELS